MYIQQPRPAAPGFSSGRAQKAAVTTLFVTQQQPKAEVQRDMLGKFIQSGLGPSSLSSVSSPDPHRSITHIPFRLQLAHEVVLGAHNILRYTANAVGARAQAVKLHGVHVAAAGADAGCVAAGICVLEARLGREVEGCKGAGVAEHVSVSLLAEMSFGGGLGGETHGLGMRARSSNDDASGVCALTTGEYCLWPPSGLSGLRPACRSR